ncbi:unnamed protein product [Microthlaspi erraticum]|uniref:Uncharacterized protein n=1 Tax=Microthlaspi erraticum TaxID=1685480 RepID=A0A6D2J541_9BRAS|nr:unnamed protein product [Microthlaspi erraticum]
MGISFSIPCDPCINKISNWLDEKVGYIHNLKKNLTALVTSMEELKAKRDDLSRMVTREEDRGLQRLSGFQVWLNRVATMENRVSDLLIARTVELQRLCLCGFCSKSLRSSYRYGKNVFLTLREAEKLKSREFEVIVEQAQTSEVDERQLQPIIVGQETMLEKAWNHLMEEGVGVMGMYGMGGVGKTTLLTQLYNKFSEERRGFDFVIWVVVSKELHVEKIQREITQKIGLGGGEEWEKKDKNQKADVIYNFFRKKRFLLFLDDLWEKVNLAEIGIPFPIAKNRCKVAFTTRSQDVCSRMGVEDPMEVQCLADNDAFDLFQKKVGQITLGSDPEILSLAKVVARKCRGLPLALNVIGETMSCKRTIQEWHHAVDVLTSYAIEFSGMEDQILPLLKYSYDNMKEKHVKSCLLYCALFPEDYRISKETLIDYWICEGIIDGSDGIERAENKGYEVIGSLVRASLLMEEVEPDETKRVCMHDVVREMALWIASHLGKEKEAFIACAGVGLYKMPKVKNWNGVRRISLMNNRINHLAGSPECLQLTTLLLQNGNLESISSEFLKSMPKLAVLDLSGNHMLRELPEGISDLVSLQYLNLSGTGISNLPLGMQQLKKLIHLDLENTPNLGSIARILKVPNLKVLKLYGFRLSLALCGVEVLETLEYLEIFSTGINHRGGLKILGSDRLMSCTRSLKIRTTHLESNGLSLPVTMDKLRYFSIHDCAIPEIKTGRICNKSKTVSPLHNPREPCFLSLSKVKINSCRCLRELTLLMFVPNLKDLDVGNADQLEDIISKEKTCEGEETGIVPFAKLVFLKFECLLELKNIYWSPLPFPCLKQLSVFRCPNLKKIPLDSQSGMHGGNGLVVKYKENSWIEGVEWEDEATKTRFVSSCELV